MGDEDDENDLEKDRVMKDKKNEIRFKEMQKELDFYKEKARLGAGVGMTLDRDEEGRRI